MQRFSKKLKKFTRYNTRAKVIGDIFMEIMVLDDQPVTLIEDWLFMSHLKKNTIFI